MGWSQTTQNTIAFAAIALGGAGVVALQATHSRWPQDPFSFVQWTDWLVFTPGPALSIIGGSAAVALGAYGLLAPHIIPYLPARPDPATHETCARIWLQLSMLNTKDGLPPAPVLNQYQMQAIGRVLKSRIWRDVRAREAFLADNVRAALTRLRDTARRRPWEVERFRDLGILLVGHAPDEAQSILSLAERMEPGDFWTRYALAHLARRRADLSEGENLARAALDAATDDIESIIGMDGLAQIQLAQGDVAAAFLLCRQAHDIARHRRGAPNDTASARQTLSGTLVAIADTLAAQGFSAQAADARAEAETLLKPIQTVESRPR